MKSEAGKKVIVGLSGGVDSAVAAALLQENGYEVSGVFLRLWKTSDKAESNQNDPEKEAQEICETLGIPFRVIDVRERFKKTVVQYFLEEYKSGRTPNPCVFCNQNLKFKVLLEELTKLNADYVATGHYARLKREIPNPKSQNSNKSQFQKPKSKTVFRLFTARDIDKDQSYFLYTLTQEQLGKIIFPLGEYTKAQVRELAREFEIPVAEKKESQDVCFLGALSTEEFLKKNIQAKKGKIIDTKGKTLGEHDGLFLYTLGQRRGINIGGTGPYYVIEKNYRKNCLVVSNNPSDLDLMKNKFEIGQANWISGKPHFPLETLAVTRYHNPQRHAIIKKSGNIYQIELKEPERAVTPGQSAVFYTPEGEVLGGGVIR